MPLFFRWVTNLIYSERDFNLVQQEHNHLVRFSAMASKCEILLDTDDRLLAQKLAQTAFREAKRIEQKYSRYLKDNIVSRINNSHGRSVALDAETLQLFSFADKLYQLSAGLFDITSGVLRKAWRFDGSNILPDQKEIDSILPNIGWKKVGWKKVGWEKVGWEKPTVTESEIILPAGMQIDLGGIGKEYAVDKTLAIICELTSIPVLVNYGGDIATNGTSHPQKFWTVGIESIDEDNPHQTLRLKSGALATSGDQHRCIVKDGKRYGHILNPRTGWPIENAPRSITVAANTCVEAGTLSTLAMLQGINAEDYLSELEATSWTLRDE